MLARRIVWACFVFLALGVYFVFLSWDYLRGPFTRNVDWI